jgi:hypothetical protein
MSRSVHQPRQDVVLNVVNQSARTGSIAAIVLHDTESHDRAGASDIQSIGDFFNQGSVQASSHICIDGEGNTGRYVPDDRKAWHCAGYNSQTLGIEQIGFRDVHRCHVEPQPPRAAQEDRQVDRVVEPQVRHPDPARSRQRRPGDP